MQSLMRWFLLRLLLLVVRWSLVLLRRLGWTRLGLGAVAFVRASEEPPGGGGDSGTLRRHWPVRWSPLRPPNPDAPSPPPPLPAAAVRVCGGHGRGRWASR